MAYENLQIWQRGHRVVLATYKKSQKFPKEELFGITSQLRRAVVSIVTNIVEGHARFTQKEKARFLDISLGSLEETHYLMRLSQDLGYAQFSDEMNELRELAKMIQAYKNRLLGK